MLQAARPQPAARVGIVRTILTLTALSLQGCCWTKCGVPNVDLRAEAFEHAAGRLAGIVHVLDDEKAQAFQLRLRNPCDRSGITEASGARGKRNGDVGASATTVAVDGHRPPVHLGQSLDDRVAAAVLGKLARVRPWSDDASLDLSDRETEVLQLIAGDYRKRRTRWID